MQAVNSENSKNLQVDVWRMMQLERELVFNKEHPSYHFGERNGRVVLEYMFAFLI